MPSPRAYALALGIAHLHRPARAPVPRPRRTETRIAGEHGLEEALSASGEAPVCSAMNRHSANRSTETPQRVRLRGDLGLPLGDPDERGGRVGKGPPESGAERRGLLKEDLSEIPSTSNPSLVSICSPATAITHVPFLSPP